MPAAMSSSPKDTWVWFGVHIMAASGRGVLTRREEMLVWWVVLRDFAREGPWGEGSTRAWRVVRGFERTECACRGPMSPPPIMAILKGGVVVIFFIVSWEV